MKTFLKIAFVCLFFTFWSCTPSDYCDSINYELRNTVSAVNELRLNIEKRETQSIQKSLQKAIKQCNSSEKRVQKLGDFRGEKGLYEAAQKLLSFYHEKLETEYSKLTVGDKNSFDELKAKEQEWQQQESEFKKQISYETKKFVKKYDLNLIGD